MQFTEADISRHFWTLLDRYGISPQSDGATLREMGFDSLDLAEVMVEIESLYDITFNREDQIFRFETTVGEIIAEILKLLADN